MKDRKAKRNRSVMEWGILPQAPWDFALTRQDLLDSATALCAGRAESRPLRRRSGCVPAEPCLSLRFTQYRSKS
jgi:hypothetical protein